VAAQHAIEDIGRNPPSGEARHLVGSLARLAGRGRLRLTRTFHYEKIPS
jgi:hypothetical protein